MNGWQYEKVCGEYLQHNGFTNVQITKGSGDFGCDIIAEKNEIKYGIQCKYYDESAVGIKAIQEAVAGCLYYNCDKSMVITNSTYTRAAREYAEKCFVELLEGISADEIIRVINEIDSSSVDNDEEIYDENESVWFEAKDNNLFETLSKQIEVASDMKELTKIKKRSSSIDSSIIREKLYSLILVQENTIKTKLEQQRETVSIELDCQKKLQSKISEIKIQYEEKADRERSNIINKYDSIIFEIEEQKEQYLNEQKKKRDLLIERKEALNKELRKLFVSRNNKNDIKEELVLIDGKIKQIDYNNDCTKYDNQIADYMHKKDEAIKNVNAKYAAIIQKKENQFIEDNKGNDT